jgi:hypothetical protein
MSELITIKTKGSQFLSTNYFSTAHAAAGRAYLSWRPGFGRLFIPDSKLYDIEAMKKCEHVIVSRGQMDDIECLEVMFENATSTPPALHLPIDMTDRELPDGDNGNEFVFQAYSSDGLEFECKGYYRLVDVMPCLLALNG